MNWEYWMAVMAIWNVAVFLLYGIDKWKAQHQKWRIPEVTLLVCALMSGAAGAAIGMRVFHHKTRKWKFRILVPVFLIIQIAIIYGIVR